MAGDGVSIEIVARDGTSSVFKAIGSSASKMGQDVSKAGDQATRSFANMGSELTTVGTAMTGIGAIITAAIAAPMVAGTKAAWDQVSAVQQATVALSAYEKDASAVEKVLSELVAYARSDLGVLFQREDLFKAAQGLKVMGAETENLVEYVEIMSRAVGLGTVSWDELGMIIGRVISTGRLAGNEFDELTKAGFQLDTQLRNTNVTAEELFNALDRGIPADAMAGQVNTIEGQLVRFRSSVRELGLAILQVDRDTSQFIEGGLGDRLANGIGQAREVMLSLRPVAEGIGEALAGAAGIVSGAVDVFLSLPEPVQTSIAALTGLSGIALTAGGAFLLLLPRIIETRTALQALGGVSGVLRGGVSALSGVFSPLGLAMAAVGAFGLSLVDLWQDQKRAADDLNASLTTLDSTLEQIRRSGDVELANIGKGIKKQIVEIEDLLDDFGKTEMPNPLDFESNTEYQQAVNEHLNATDAMRESALLAAPAIAAYNAALNDTTVDIDAYSMYVDQMLRAAAATEDTADDIEALKWIIASANEMPAEFLTNIQDGAENAQGAIDALLGSVAQMPGMWSEAVAEQKAAEEALQKLKEEWIAGALAIGGYDDALSMINMTGMASDMSRFAESGIQAADAFDNVFRTLVTNVQGIGSGVQEATTWLEGLFAVNDEGWSQMDALVTEGRISIDEYTAAQVALGEVQAANYDIQQNLLAVQAMQAPFIAESVTATQAWVAELANMDAAQQRVALAFMDTNTVAQAQEIVMQGAAAATGEWGQNGRDAFEAVVQGAVAANPMLLQVLDTMGVITQTEFGFTINWDAVAQGESEISRLTRSIDALTVALGGVPPLDIEVDTSDVEAAASPGGPVGMLTSAFRNLQGLVAEPTVDVNGDGAITDVDNIARKLADFDNTEATATVGVEFSIPGGWLDLASQDATALGNLLGVPETITTTLDVVGAEEITEAKAAIDALDSKSVSVDIAVSGWEEIGSLFDMIRAAGNASVTVDVLIGTNELDTGLTQFGIGSGGGGGAAGFANPSITVDVTVSADTATALLNDIIRAANELQAANIVLDIAVEADTTTLNSVIEAANTAQAMSVSIPVETPGAGDSIGQLQGVAGAAAAANALAVAIPVATPGSGESIGQLQGVAGAAAAAAAMSVNIPVSVSGAGAAINALLGVAAAAASIPPSVSTTVTTNRVTNNVQTFSSVGAAASSFYADGGTVWGNDAPVSPWGLFPQAANGRSVWVGEAGPELVSLPHGAQVTPHVASLSRTGRGGGDTYSFFEGATFIGTDRNEMNRWAAEEFLPKLEQVTQRQRIAKGM